MKCILRLRVIVLSCVSVLLASCAVNMPKIDVPDVQPVNNKVAKLKEANHHPDVALVLGGGGARGYAHLGVLTVLVNHHVPINLIVGASAGSIMGSLYADKADIKHATQVMMSAKFFDIADVSIHGGMSGSHLERFILKNVQAKNFSDLKVPLIAATTDLQTGATYPISGGPIAPAVLASAAVPGLVFPVKLYGKTLVDGGAVDNVPDDVAKLYKPKVLIAVNIDKTLPKELPTSNFGVLNRAYLLMYRRYFKLYMKEYPPTVMIRPQVGQVSLFDIKDKHHLFCLGKTAALKKMNEIMQQLCANNIKLTNGQSACS